MLLLIATVVVPFSAGIGALVWPWIQLKIKWSTREMLILHCFLFSLLAVYGLLFFNSQSEILPVAAVFGFMLGGILLI